MFEPWLFTTDDDFIKRSVDAGIKGIIVDWECFEKRERQRSIDLECNHDTVQDLIRVKDLAPSKVICRLNSFGHQTKDEVEQAIRAGADILFLPMIKTSNEVVSFLKLIDGRVLSGILIETKEAVLGATDIAKLPIDYVYVGLNDLCLSRKSKNIFEAIADSTVEKLREIFTRPKFGFGGVTLIDKGSPLPFSLLIKEMSRLECNYGFLRRSFKRDIEDKNIKLEIKKITDTFDFLKRRTQDQKNIDKLKLIRTIENLDDFLICKKPPGEQLKEKLVK